MIAARDAWLHCLVRRADRSVALGESRGGLSSVTPPAGGFQILPPPIRIARLADLERKAQL